MKKLTFLLIVWIFSFATARSQDLLPVNERAPESRNEIGPFGSDIVPVTMLKRKNVDILTKDKLKSQFVDPMNVQWDKWGTFDEASFTLNGKNMNAYYDPKGNLVGTTQDETIADLPVKAQQTIATKYKNYKIGPITFYNDHELRQTEIVYWSERIEDATSYFAELSKGPSRIILQITPFGEVTLYKNLS